MEDTLITFETAKLAKEKGFDVKTTHNLANKVEISYKNYGRHDILENDTYENVTIPAEEGVDGTHLHNKFVSERFYQPTQSLLQRWLREKHRIYIISKPFHDSLLDKTTYVSDVIRIGDGKVIKSPKLDTHEESLEYALLEALKLIK